METPVVFGDAENLFVIINVPEEKKARTALVMLTAGMLHHVGSFRFHVLLARELEKFGILELARFVQQSVVHADLAQIV